MAIKQNVVEAAPTEGIKYDLSELKCILEQIQDRSYNPDDAALGKMCEQCVLYLGKIPSQSLDDIKRNQEMVSKVQQDYQKLIDGNSGT
jgi:hypothetical protein